MSEQLDITEFRILRDHLREACGLYFADDKYPRVAKVVGSRMSEIRIPSYSEYHRLLTSPPLRGEELTALAALLTVGETHFFRNKDHWRALAECVVPWILGRNAATRQHHIRMWSAGCSTGEEAFTISIVLARILPDLAQRSIEIIGTDINPSSIAAAKTAVYTEHSFRGVAPEIKKAYFEPVAPGRYRPRAEIRDKVRFEEMNLLDPIATARLRDVDVIFCRNVLIYFDAPSSQRVLAHFQRSLRADGYLFLGHSESTHGSSSGFATLSVCNTHIYRSVPRTARGIDTSPSLDCEPAVPAALRNSFEARRPGREQRRRTTGHTVESKAAIRIGTETPARAPTDAKGRGHRKGTAPPGAVATPEVPSLDLSQA